MNWTKWTNIDSYSPMYRMWKFIKIKIIKPGLFWLDQNCGFFYSKIDCFLASFCKSHKAINFTIKKSTILIQSKKPWLNDFNFDKNPYPMHQWVWIIVGSLGSIHDPWSTLETPVKHLHICLYFSVTYKPNLGTTIYCSFIVKLECSENQFLNIWLLYFLILTQKIEIVCNQSRIKRKCMKSQESCCREKIKDFLHFLPCFSFFSVLCYVRSHVTTQSRPL